MRWLAAVLLVALSPISGNAIWMRTCSLEWWTDQSDVVATVEVISVKRIAPLNEHWESQEVTCSILETLKGGRKTRFVFRQDFSKALDEKNKTNDYVLRAQDRVVAFYA